MQRKPRATRTRPSTAPVVPNKLNVRVQLEYREITELKNYDLTTLVGSIFKRDSGKRVFHKDASGCFIWDGWVDSDGYGSVSFEGKTCRVHRLVYERCIGPLLDAEVVRHSCDTPSCIHPLHLHKETQADNIADKVRKGRQARHSTHPGAILTCRRVASIKRELSEGYRNQSALARKHNVSQSTIWCIANGITWRN